MQIPTRAGPPPLFNLCRAVAVRSFQPVGGLPARWWAGARGGLHALQHLLSNDNSMWRPRELVPPYQEIHRMVQAGRALRVLVSLELTSS